jgi:hypothetical protein
MKRYAEKAAVIALLLAGICAAPLIGGFSAAAQSAAAAGEQVVVNADHSFLEALTKHDKAAVGNLLDANFEWTDTEGTTRKKADALQALDALASDSQGDADVKTLFYGELGLVAGTHHDARLMRIWVKRPAGWRMLVYLDTPAARQAAGGAAPGAGGAARGGGAAAGGGGGEEGGQGDCDNPCRTLPYKPTTTADKAVLAEWQKTKMDEWHPNAGDWATHIADEFMIINNGSARNKPERVATAKAAEARGAGAPGAPILSMTMSDFGNTVVMISRHVPYQGGKPYYNVRVFVNRDNHWPLIWSQQTTIQSAAPLPAVSAKK